jgi:hypothetical protein
MLNNPDFYPTPETLITKMCSKVKWNNVQLVLEPSAGSGNIVNYLKEKRISGYYRKTEVHAIENDLQLQKLLIGSDIDLVDTDFLKYAGGDAYDLIIMNPPFSDGDKHLLKAIELMYNGQIVCLLNAETLKNPYSHTRKSLVKKLQDLNADIEYIQNAFIDAERKTNVEIALIYINIENDIEDVLFKNSKLDANDDLNLSIEDSTQIAHRGNIDFLVSEYEDLRKQGVQFYLDYYGKFRKLREYIPLANDSGGKVSDVLNAKVNSFLKNLRKTYWKKAIEIPEINKNMTSVSVNQFNEQIRKYSKMDFTLVNIHNFALNLSESYMDTIGKSVVALFDDFTRKYAWNTETDKNRLHFDTWKTNDAFKIGNKVINPYFRFWDSDWNRWDVSWNLKAKLDDIDKVISYFDENRNDYIKMSDVITRALEKGITKKIESTYFICNIYKKGTLHLEFKNNDTLRRFNIFVCKDKGWLPNYYSQKPYEEMSDIDKQLVKNFDDDISNYKVYNQNSISDKNLLQIGFLPT